MFARIIVIFVLAAVLPSAAGSAAAGSLAGVCEPVCLAELRLTVVYDNMPGPEGLTADWGFACLIEGAGEPLLFDTGRQPIILRANMQRLGADPARIQRVFLSHAHADHYGGIAAVLKANPQATVYAPPAWRSAAQAMLPDGAGSFVEISGPRRLGPHLLSTGPLKGAGIAEQALLVLTAGGPVVITGCAHPGVVTIVRRAGQLSGRPVQLLMGGFHLVNRGDSEIDHIIARLKDLGVARVAPCHCTGSRAQARLAQAYGQNCFACRVGRVITGAALQGQTSE
jgi:7,8-dihydropterin-6-yl-methyl-4-(beta-D-ribofuranosyl)aminobenzene 5'-phosphate synthase